MYARAAQAILDTNIITAPLKGILIGNGWIDPINQYLALIHKIKHLKDWQRREQTPTKDELLYLHSSNVTRA